MLYREIIAVCSEIHTKNMNTLCGQNEEFVNVRSGDTYTDQWAEWDIYTEHFRRKGIVNILGGGS